MPNLNNQQKLVLFFSIGALIGIIAAWGALGIFLAMIVLDNKAIFSKD